MERGPVALFGALIAVGLGPALWLGTQFGQTAVTPQPKPPITADANQDSAPGRAGAAPDDESAEVIDPDGTETGLIPLSSTPSARPSTSSPADVPSTTDPTVVKTTSPAPTRSTGSPTPPPTESTTTTTTPVAEPSDESTDEPTKPATLAPPAGEQVTPLEIGYSSSPAG